MPSLNLYWDFYVLCAMIEKVLALLSHPEPRDESFKVRFKTLGEKIKGKYWISNDAIQTFCDYLDCKEAYNKLKDKYELIFPGENNENIQSEEVMDDLEYTLRKHTFLKCNENDEFFALLIGLLWSLK